MAGHISRLLPNTLTCCNLVSGCIATSLALNGMAKEALWWIIIGSLFDFFDGFSARALGILSPIGKELDSLADDITFGFAPSAILYTELCVMEYPSFLEATRSFLPYVAFIMAAFSALRLAKFNIDERQTTSFIGMPTPANALFWASLIVSYTGFIESSSWMLPVIIALMLFCCWLMIAELPMFALKFKHRGWEGNEVKYSFLIFSILAITILGFVRSFSLIIPCYVLLSIVLYIRNGKKAKGTHENEAVSNQ